jgi:hypothetical protein
MSTKRNAVAMPRKSKHAGHPNTKRVITKAKKG